MIKLIDILEEGALLLTPSERNQIEQMIPDIISIISGKQISSNLGDAVYAGTIDYEFADKSKGKVKVFVSNDTPSASGYFRTNDPNNPTDNEIIIQQNNFSYYFGIISKAQKFLAGDENAGIEELRKTLKHELIHAKDPALNQHYLKEPYDSSKPEIYYKSWAEFQTMTGQFLESIIAGIDRLLSTNFSNKAAKKVEIALSEILNFFAGKSPVLSQDTFDFIQNTKSRNFFQKLIKNIENTTGIHPTGNSLSIYLAYISAIKRYHPDAYNEFLKDLYKTIDQAKDRVNSVIDKERKDMELKYGGQASQVMDDIGMPTNIKLREMQYINEAKRLQKLAGIITEAEEAKVEQNIEDGLEKLLQSLKSAEQNVKPSPQDGQLDEIALTLAALTAGAPGLLNFLGKGVNWLANHYSLKDVDHTTVGDALQKAGHKLEHNYIDSIAGWLQASFPKKYKGQDPHDIKSDLHDKAHGIYAATLLGAAVVSGIEAGHAAGLIAKGLEGGAAALKTSEVVQLAQKIAAA